MKPGRELDALIAKDVFGLKPCSDPLGRCDAAHANPIQCWGTGGAGSELRSYSERIEDAWEVLENFVYPKIWFDHVAAKWVCSLAPAAALSIYSGKVEKKVISARGETAAHAICLAALEAKCVE